MSNTTHGMINSKEYSAWRGMKSRSNKHGSIYPLITYVDEWESFKKFFEDMGNKPEHSELVRKDSSLPYSKENCEWCNTSLLKVRRGLKVTNKAGYPGIYKSSTEGKFRAFITHLKTKKYLGTFDSLEIAIAARKKAEIELYGFDRD